VPSRLELVVETVWQHPTEGTRSSQAKSKPKCLLVRTRSATTSDPAPDEKCAFVDKRHFAGAGLAAPFASMRLRSSRGRFLVALSLIAHCDSEARGRSR
jgi:hypothetical protein